jgi:hypothetical protein
MTTMRELFEELESELDEFKAACPPGHKMVFGRCVKVDPYSSAGQRQARAQKSVQAKLYMKRRAKTAGEE